MNTDTEQTTSFIKPPLQSDDSLGALGALGTSRSGSEVVFSTTVEIHLPCLTVRADLIQDGVQTSAAENRQN